MLDRLEQGETPGDQLQGIGYTVYKVRVKNSDAQRGKSGGYRVIYYVQTEEHITMLAMYSKSDQADIGAETLRRYEYKNHRGQTLHLTSSLFLNYFLFSCKSPGQRGPGLFISRWQAGVHRQRRV